MFRILFLLLILGIEVSAQQSRADEILFLLENHPERKLIAAHRGGHNEVPENSLAAIDKAAEAGAHIVELDVRETKDGILVIMHDKTLERTTTGSGLVEDYTWDELKKLKLLHNGKATSFRIPSFEEALRHSKGRILVDVDFKASGMPAREKAYDLIAKLGMENEVIFFLYDYTEMKHLFDVNPKIRMMPRAYSYEMLDEILKLNMTRIIHLDSSFTDQERLKKIPGVRWWANTLGVVDQAAVVNLNAFTEFNSIFSAVNILQTDQPALLNQYLSK